MQLLLLNFLLLLMFTILINRIRSARIKTILDNCLATNEIGQMIPKNDLREEVEWYVDTYPGFPERSMHTGEYLYPLRPDPMDAPKPDAALADFRNVDHAETWGVPNSTKKRGESFHSLLGVRVDKQILRTRRSIKKRTALTSGLSQRGANPARFIASRSARKRSSSAKSKQADTTRSFLKVLEDEPNLDSYIDEMCGACAYYLILSFYFYLIQQIDCTIVC